MPREVEKILDEYVIETGEEDFLKINLDKGTIRASKHDRELMKSIDKKKAINMLKKSKVDETRLTAGSLVLLCLLYERGVNINTIVSNKLTEREVLNILYLLERGSIVPQDIKGKLRKEPLASKLKLNTKVIKGNLRKQVIKLSKPMNDMGTTMVPRTYWVDYSYELEYEDLVGCKKERKRQNEKR